MRAGEIAARFTKIFHGLVARLIRCGQATSQFYNPPLELAEPCLQGRDVFAVLIRFRGCPPRASLERYLMSRR